MTSQPLQQFEWIKILRTLCYGCSLLRCVLSAALNPSNSRFSEGSLLVPLMIFKGRNVRREVNNWFHGFAYGFGLDLTL